MNSFERADEAMEMKGSGGRWCILQTRAAHTLRLAGSLIAAGFDAWTPSQTVKRPAPGRARRYVMGQCRPMVEVARPILPGFVFVRADRQADLIRLGRSEASTHHAFTVFRIGDRVPEIGDAQVAGLRDAEAQAEAAIRGIREAETREEADRLRIAALKTERERTKATRRAEHDRRQTRRAERRDFPAGTTVEVLEMPALTGMVGIVATSRGRTAQVRFGTGLVMQIEAWRLVPHDVVEQTEAVA